MTRVTIQADKQQSPLRGRRVFRWSALLLMSASVTGCAQSSLLTQRFAQQRPEGSRMAANSTNPTSSPMPVARSSNANNAYATNTSSPNTSSPNTSAPVAAVGATASSQTGSLASGGSSRRSLSDRPVAIAPSEIAPVSYTAASQGNSVAPVSAVLPKACHDQYCSARATCAVPSDCQACATCQPEPGGPVPPYWNDQEYLYDGGDRDPKVAIKEDWTVEGLNPTDTVAHYETIEGKLCISPSNRVPIYAPRFGAVRKTSAPILAEQTIAAGRILEPVGPAVEKSRDLAGNMRQPVGPKNQSALKVLDALRDQTRGVPKQKVMPLVIAKDFQNALLKLENIGTSIRAEDLEALLQEYMVGPLAISPIDTVGVMIGGVNATLIRDAKSAQEVVLYESEPGKCSLRVCKSASQREANPGDEITFVIRFENLGVQPIGNLVVMDSLTTRLEYIDGSQKGIMSLKKEKGEPEPDGTLRFSTSENEAGSTVLRWEIESPLKHGDGGVVTFRCRVR